MSGNTVIPRVAVPEGSSNLMGMNPESSYIAHQWYCLRNGRMVPILGDEERARREQLLAEMYARQVQTRRQLMKVVVSR